MTPLRARPLFAAARLRRLKGRGHEAAADQGKGQRKSKEPRGRAPGRLRGANKARGHLAEDRPATCGPRAREDRRPEATAVRRIRERPQSTARWGAQTRLAEGGRRSATGFALDAGDR